MNLNSVKISNFQATVYIVMLILPTSILFVPSIVTKWGRQDAWVSLLIALDIGIITAWVASKLALCFPDETIVQYAKRIVGRYFGILIGILYTYNYYFIAYATQRQFSGMMNAQLLPETPMWFVNATIMIIVCYVIYVGLEPLARANYFSFITISAYAILLAIIAFMSFEAKNFFPVFGTPINEISIGAITPASWLTECAVIIMLVPFLIEKNKAAQISVSAVLIVFAFLFIVLLINLGVFGPNLLRELIFPTFTGMQVIIFEEINVIDILDVVMMSIWVFGIAFKMATALFAGTLALKQLLGLPSYKILIIPGGILTTILSLSAWEGSVDVLEYSEKVFPPYLITIHLLLPALLLLIVKVKGSLNSKMGEIK